MSEVLPVNHEREKEPSPENAAEQREKLREAKEAAEKARNEHEDSIEKIRHKIDTEAISGKEAPVGDVGKDKKSQASPIIDRTVKGQAYKKTLRHVRRSLPKRQRTLSKVIHQPAVEAISEVSAKTIARPSGMLGAGICAFIGTSVVVWLSHHYGFAYNFFVFIALVVIGFALGLVIEYFWRLVKRLRRS